MKKLLLIFLLLVTLTSCNEKTLLNTKATSTEVSILKKSEEKDKEVETEKSYFIKSSVGLPNYIDILNCDSNIQSAFDWDESTFLEVDNDFDLKLEFKKEESVSTLELVSENIRKVRLNFSNNEFKEITITEHTTKLDLVESILSEYLSIEILESDTNAVIKEIHIQADLKLSKSEYDELTKLRNITEKIAKEYDWTAIVKENQLIAKEVIETNFYSSSQIIFEEMDIELIDQDIESFIGTPIYLSGKIIEITNESLVLQSLISLKKIIILTDEEHNLESIVSFNGIILGKENGNIVLTGIK